MFNRRNFILPTLGCGVESWGVGGFVDGNIHRLAGISSSLVLTSGAGSARRSAETVKGFLFAEGDEKWREREKRKEKY